MRGKECAVEGGWVFHPARRLRTRGREACERGARWAGAERVGGLGDRGGRGGKGVAFNLRVRGRGDGGRQAIRRELAGASGA